MELKGYTLKSCLGENINQGRKTYLAEDKDGFITNNICERFCKLNR